MSSWVLLFTVNVSVSLRELDYHSNECVRTCYKWDCSLRLGLSLVWMRACMLCTKPQPQRSHTYMCTFKTSTHAFISSRATTPTWGLGYAWDRRGCKWVAHMSGAARSVEDETRNDRRNTNRNIEWWGNFSQLVEIAKLKFMVSRGTSWPWDFDWIWIPLYLPVPFQIVVLDLQLTKISPPFRISICISTIIPSLIFHGTGCTTLTHSYVWLQDKHSLLKSLCGLMQNLTHRLELSL